MAEDGGQTAVPQVARKAIHGDGSDRYPNGNGSCADYRNIMIQELQPVSFVISGKAFPAATCAEATRPECPFFACGGGSADMRLSVNEAITSESVHIQLLHTWSDERMVGRSTDTHATVPANRADDHDVWRRPARFHSAWLISIEDKVTGTTKRQQSRVVVDHMTSVTRSYERLPDQPVGLDGDVHVKWYERSV